MFMSMRQFTIQTTVTEYARLQELDDEGKNLMEKAKDAAQNAYAPYSEFKVGAAVLLDNNEIITGTNQENAAYPSGLCAERVALFYAAAQFPDAKIKAIAITADSSRYAIHSPVYPCGSCRQAISEYEQRDNSPIRIIMMGKDGVIQEVNSVLQLLPMVFNNQIIT
jgi:cytidine deaminase